MQARPLIKILTGPLLGLAAYLLMADAGHGEETSRMAGTAVWMAAWWITEAVSIFFTALLPVVLFPLLGIMSMKEVAPAYMNEIIFLFVGGFLIAFTIERWDLHRRIALYIMIRVGSTPARLLAGFMLSSWFLSMWIVNTAVTMMLLPAVLAVIRQVEKHSGKASGSIAVAFLLGLAYASSIGGSATLVGTAPNMVFAGYFNQNFPEHAAVNFTNWIVYALPVSIVFLLLCFFTLRLLFLRGTGTAAVDPEACRAEYRRLGPFSYEERVVSIVFGITVLLWFFRKDIALGSFTVPGWVNLLPEPLYAEDSTVAMLMSCVLFLWPSRRERGSGLLDWQQVQKIPLGILFLFGGGFALANGISDTGLSAWLAGNLQAVRALSPFIVVTVLCFFMTFFTELTSNTASTYLVLPILTGISLNFDAGPLLFMVPVVISASYAFMLPVATPPNTIVFGSEYIRMRDMVRAGLILNVIGAILNIAAIFTWGKIVW